MLEIKLLFIFWFEKCVFVHTIQSHVMCTRMSKLKNGKRNAISFGRYTYSRQQHNIVITFVVVV